MDTVAENLEITGGERLPTKLPFTGAVPTVDDLLALVQSADWLRDLVVVIKTPDGMFHKDVFIGFGHLGGDPCGKCVILAYGK